MKTIILEVARSDIEGKVAQTTAYLGWKSPGEEGRGELLDRVATVDGDAAMLSGFIAEGYASAVERLKGFVADAAFSEDNVRLMLEVSGAYDDSVTPTLATGFRSFLVATVMAGWLRLSFPDKAEEWEKEAQRLLFTMERNLYHRRRPCRRANLKPSTLNF